LSKSKAIPAETLINITNPRYEEWKCMN
jgi:hypothetical protein